MYTNLNKRFYEHTAVAQFSLNPLSQTNYHVIEKKRVLH